MAAVSGEGLTTSVFKVSGMDCVDEIEAVKTALDIPGVNSVEANLIQSKVEVLHEQSVSRELLVQKIESAGLGVDEVARLNSKGRPSARILLVSISGVLLLLALVLPRLVPSTLTLVRIFALLATMLSGSLVLPKAIRAIRGIHLDMNVLMVVAALGALGIGEYVEGAAVVFLFSFAELLEGFSVEKARKSIQSLLKLSPETALLKKNGVKEVPVAEVKKGDVILIRSGSRIPLDGIVVSGASSVNQAPITGESIPIEKTVGDRVLAGTLNEQGSLEVEVSSEVQDTKLSQIIRLIEDAQKQRAPTQRFVDNFARFYTPIVFVMAILVLMIPPLLFGGVWSVWIYRSLVLLVIACPCALVISTPVSIVSGLTAMAKRGVLIKGGAGLEAIGKLKALAVDKTGTITQGKPQVVQMLPQGQYSVEDVLKFASAIDLHSSHPLARAVVEAAKARDIKSPVSIGYKSLSGRGAEAVIDGHFYFVGNHRFTHENAVCSDALEKILIDLQEQAQSVVVVGHRPHAGCPGEIIGVIGIADPIRSDAKEAITALHGVGIKSVVMLSGDNVKTVDAISNKVGIDEAYGDLMPADKVLKVKELRDRFGSVAMIGDGVNDAPAMASASLGVAMGASGTDTAIEASDVTLMQDRLIGIAEAIKMGKRTLGIIWFNTAFAIGVKLVFLALALLGYSSLWIAIAADTGATLLVIANALRLLATKDIS